MRTTRPASANPATSSVSGVEVVLSLCCSASFSGPKKSDCTTCRNVSLFENNRLSCLDECKKTHYEERKWCLSCHESCYDLGWVAYLIVIPERLFQMHRAEQHSRDRRVQRVPIRLGRRVAQGIVEGVTKLGGCPGCPLSLHGRFPSRGL